MAHPLRSGADLRGSFFFGADHPRLDHAAAQDSASRRGWLPSPEKEKTGPRLPVVRRQGGERDIGALQGALYATGCTRSSPTLVLMRFFLMPAAAAAADFLALTGEAFDSAEEMAAAGGAVD